MAEILATKTSLPGCEGPGTFEAARAGALFASTLQPSGSPSPGQIRRAVAATQIGASLGSLEVATGKHLFDPSRAERWRPWRAYAALHLWAAGIAHPIASGKTHDREAA